MSETSEDCVRLRACVNAGCHTLFAVCVSCDHGQRYCGDDCRRAARQRQVRAASKRYQATAHGKELHRCRQRSYRERLGQESVTHQALPTGTMATQTPSSPPPRCLICGGGSVWVDPFPVLPLYFRHRRRRRKAASVQISTFCDDR